MAVRPVVELVRAAAPRTALLIVTAQLFSGVVSALALLATTEALSGLLAPGSASGRLSAALPGVALVVSALAVRGALDAAVNLLRARLIPAVRRVAEERLIDAGLRVELAAYDDADFYHRLHRARDRGLMRLEEATEDILALIGAALSVTAAAGTLSVLHPALLPVLALGVIPDGWAVLRAARLDYASQSRTVTLQRRLAMISELALRRESAPEIRAYQAEPFVLDEYRELADAFRDHRVRVGLAQARVRAVGRAMSGLGLGTTFVALGLLVHAEWVPLAVAGTAVIAIRAATTSLAQLVLAANHIFEKGLYIADYEEFRLDAGQRTRPATGRRTPAAPGRVELREVTFRYPGSPDDPPALRAVNLSIDAGQTIALVGENGSGKTTLAKLIAGLYRPTAGQVTWDSVDLAEYDPASVADRVMMVLQEPVRWPHSARANVRVGRHDRADPDERALHAAAVQARADEIIAQLPQGWGTLLSKYFRGGRELSGGQWQRLAVARGLYRDAPLLIWDEPTAPLDARAEYAVYESLRQLAGGRTVILITHRLASVRHADRIYLLHDGVLAEQGTHAELLAEGGRYAELHELQSRLREALT